MCYRLIERVFVFVLLLSSMTVVDALTRPAYASARDPKLISTDVPLPTVLIESGVYAAGALLVLMRWRRVLNATLRVWPLAAMMFLAVLSIVWSDVPTLTMRRSAFLVGSTLIGIYLGERFSIEQQLRWLAHVLCVIIVASILLYFISPSGVIDYNAYGGWKGVTINKNTFGWYMALAVAALTLLRFRSFRWSRYVFLFAAAILLLLSRSATSLVGCVLMISFIPFWRMIQAGKTRYFAYILMATAVLAGISFMWAEQALLFRALGRDFTFTGRTDLWLLLLSAIGKHPFLGYGYGAFWSGMKGEALNIYLASGWLPTGAHNGYLELWLGVGILGLPILLYLIVRSLLLATEYMRSDESWSSIWPMTYLLMFVFHNFFESHLLETRSLEFLMFAAITTSLALRPRGIEARPAHSSPYALAHGKQPVYSLVAVVHRLRP